MRATTFAVSLCLSALLLPLTACNKSGQTTVSPPKTFSPQPAKETKPVDFFGVDLHTVNRKTLEAHFHQTLKTPLVPRNEHESVAEAATIFPEAGTVEVAMTQGGALAKMQFVFPGKGDPALAARVTRLMESRYGTPSGAQGKIEQGEYRAVWDRGDDFIIQVGRGWPDTTVFLNFASTKHLAQLREDLQKKLASPQNLTITRP